MGVMDIALMCRALGDSNRLKIVRLLSGGERCACELLKEFDITQPTLSHHMKILCECGLVDARKEGRWNHYSLNRPAMEAFSGYFDALSCAKEGRSCDCR